MTIAGSKVGIGTSSPNSMLHISGTSSVTGLYVSSMAGSAAQFNSSAANGSYLTLSNGSSAYADIGAAKQAISAAYATTDLGINVRGANNLILAANNVEALRIDGSGNVGIGKTPSANLDVSGSIFHSGILTDLSDRRMKQNIQPISPTLQNVLSLLPVRYQKKATPTLTEYGFIAQDVLAIFPPLVTTANDPSHTMSLNYIGLIAPVVKAMQEMEARQELHENATDKRFSDLKADNDNLRHELEEVREEVRALKRAHGGR